MSVAEILPTRATFGTGDSVVVEVRGAVAKGEVIVRRLGDEVLRTAYDGSASVVLGWLPVGAYGVELVSGDTVLRTAVEVRTVREERLRYGFAVDYSPGRDLAGIRDTARRLHLTAIMFYDWAYRHADLLGGGEQYSDPLGQPVSLGTVRALAHSLAEVGTAPIGYAAVYAVGPAEWDRWKHDALLTASGEPYSLGDFLFIVDPAAGDWLDSFAGQLRQATELGFAGFHLDQFGYPKRARRADGEVVDLAVAFPAMIERVRSELPNAQLVFNNVNDFPTWTTGGTPQDAVYIEPWEPATTLGRLADIVTRARTVGGGKPVVLAAYQHVYDFAPTRQADLATAFTMAMLYSHGATQILAGEPGRILVDPYYVRNHVVEDSTADLLVRWYNFLVEHDEILLEPSIVDVTPSYAAEYNDECDVRFDGFDVSSDARAGSVWRRITVAGDRLVVHLVNLVGQEDTVWDAARAEPAAIGSGVLRFRRVAGAMPRVRVADPDGSARLVDVLVELDGDFASAVLPEFSVWQVIVIELAGSAA